MNTTRLALLLAALTAPVLSFAQSGLGGVRSNGLIREEVSVGYVPPPESFSVEGMLGEHNTPVKPERCAGYFCVYGALGHGVRKTTGEGDAWLLVEPIDGIDPAHFQRSALNATIVLDRSGSMGGWKFTAELQAAHAIVDRLDEGDTLSIVVFDQAAQVVVAPARVSQKRRFHTALDGLAIGGSTNLHEGLSLAFETVRQHAHRTGVTDRVFLFTDEQPNTGDTGTGSFLELVGTAAGEGIGLSVVGVGLDLGLDLANKMSQLSGGSYHYLETAGGVQALFGEGFGATVTPVATALSVKVIPAPGLRVAQVYGVPADHVAFDPATGSATFRAATVFYDPRRSGVVVRMEPDRRGDATPAHARVRLEYSYRRMDNGAQETGQTTLTHDARVEGSLAEFEATEHYRAYALVNFAEGLVNALTWWQRGEHANALQALAVARSAMDDDARALRDAELSRERDLADRLLVAMGGSLTRAP